jgi:hypothetical protein
LVIVRLCNFVKHNRIETGLNWIASDWARLEATSAMLPAAGVANPDPKAARDL